MDQEPHEVRLYSNRRLYDPAQRRYIKFDDLYDLLLNGVQFTIHDQQKGQDFTHRVMIDLLVRKQSQLGAQEAALLSTVFLELFIRLANSEASPLVAKFLDHTAQGLLINTSLQDYVIAAPSESTYKDELSRPYATEP